MCKFSTQNACAAYNRRNAGIGRYASFSVLCRPSVRISIVTSCLGDFNPLPMARMKFADPSLKCLRRMRLVIGDSWLVSLHESLVDSENSRADIADATNVTSNCNQQLECHGHGVIDGGGRFVGAKPQCWLLSGGKTNVSG